MKRYFVLLIALLLLLGCAAPAASSQAVLSPSMPSATPDPTPVPSPTPSPLDAEAAQRQWEQLFIFSPDLASCLPADAFDEGAHQRFLAASVEERLWILDCAEEVAAQLSAAAQRAAEQLSAACGGVDYTLFVEAPSWQLIYALLRVCNNPAALQSALGESVCASLTLAGQGDAHALEISVQPLDYAAALALACAEEQALLGGKFVYSYMYTVFDETAAECGYALPPAEGNLAASITWPLASHTRLRKTWYADRDSGTRRHTGTDIWARADTEIYSCTDGTVTFVGNSAGAGNAVVVTDAYGYEFHYYHMIRLTDFLQPGDTVAAGDLIGHVGNTGNSARDHLHLTIVAPDGLYINPYPYLAAVEP